MNKIDVGIVGLGWWGPKLLRNFKSHPSVNKIYGYDESDEAIQNSLMMDLSFKPAENYKSLLNSVSSVVVSTPPKTHYKIVKEALESRKDVLVTKPPTESREETAVLGKIAKEKNLTFMVDATYIFNPVLEAIFSSLNKNNVENLKSIRIIRYGDDLRLHHIDRLRKTMFSNDTDIIKDLIFHDISILVYLFEEKIEIESVKKLYNLNKTCCDSAILFLKVKNIPIIFEYSWIYPERKREIQFYYNDKFLVFDDLRTSEKLWEFSYENKTKRILEYTLKEPLFCVVDHFISCIENKTEPITGVDFMMKTMEIMEKIVDY